MRKRLIGLCVVIVVLAGTGIGLSRVPQCRLDGWFATTVVAAGQAPVTLEEISKYRLNYRRAFFRALPVETRRALWQENLTAFTQTETLTAEQAAFIEEAREVVRGAFEVPVDPVTYQLLTSRAAALFSNAQMRRLSRLGPDDRAPVANNRLQPAGGGGGGEKACECFEPPLFQPTWDCPEWSRGCIDGWDNCDSSWFGCGFLNLSNCVGMCYYGSINAAPDSAPRPRP